MSGCYPEIYDTADKRLRFTVTDSGEFVDSVYREQQSSQLFSKLIGRHYVSPTTRKIYTAADVVCEGYLYKKGSWMKNWKKRYFVLRKDIRAIHYYTSREDLTLLGSIELDLETRIVNIRQEDPEADGFPNVVGIESDLESGESSRTLVRFETFEKMKAWMIDIKNESQNMVITDEDNIEWWNALFDDVPLVEAKNVGKREGVYTEHDQDEKHRGIISVDHNGRSQNKLTFSRSQQSAPGATPTVTTAAAVAARSISPVPTSSTPSKSQQQPASATSTKLTSATTATSAATAVPAAGISPADSGVDSDDESDSGEEGGHSQQKSLTNTTNNNAAAATSATAASGSRTISTGQLQPPVVQSTAAATAAPPTTTATASSTSSHISLASSLLHRTSADNTNNGKRKSAMSTGSVSSSMSIAQAKLLKKLKLMKPEHKAYQNAPYDDPSVKRFEYHEALSGLQLSLRLCNVCAHGDRLMVVLYGSFPNVTAGSSPVYSGNNNSNNNLSNNSIDHTGVTAAGQAAAVGCGVGGGQGPVGTAQTLGSHASHRWKIICRTEIRTVMERPSYSESFVPDVKIFFHAFAHLIPDDCRDIKINVIRMETETMATSTGSGGGGGGGGGQTGASGAAGKTLSGDGQGQAGNHSSINNYGSSSSTSPTNQQANNHQQHQLDKGNPTATSNNNNNNNNNNNAVNMNQQALVARCVISKKLFDFRTILKIKMKVVSQPIMDIAVPLLKEPEVTLGIVKLTSYHLEKYRKWLTQQWSIQPYCELLYSFGTTRGMTMSLEQLYASKYSMATGLALVSLWSREREGFLVKKREEYQHSLMEMEHTLRSSIPGGGGGSSSTVGPGPIAAAEQASITSAQQHNPQQEKHLSQSSVSNLFPTALPTATSTAGSSSPTAATPGNTATGLAGAVGSNLTTTGSLTSNTAVTGTTVEEREKRANTIESLRSFLETMDDIYVENTELLQMIIEEYERLSAGVEVKNNVLEKEVGGGILRRSVWKKLSIWQYVTTNLNIHLLTSRYFPFAEALNHTAIGGAVSLSSAPGGGGGGGGGGAASLSSSTHGTSATTSSANGDQAGMIGGFNMKSTLTNPAVATTGGTHTAAANNSSAAAAANNTNGIIAGLGGTIRKMHVVPTITLGCPAAHELKFHDGGLRRIFHEVTTNEGKLLWMQAIQYPDMSQLEKMFVLYPKEAASLFGGSTLVNKVIASFNNNNNNNHTHNHSSHSNHSHGHSYSHNHSIQEEMAVILKKKYELARRIDICSSQALANALTTIRTVLLLATSLGGMYYDILARTLKIGFLVMFESMLSTQGAEIGMIEDLELSALWLSLVTVRLVVPMQHQPAAQSPASPPKQSPTSSAASELLATGEEVGGDGSDSSRKQQEQQQQQQQPKNPYMTADGTPVMVGMGESISIRRDKNGRLVVDMHISDEESEKVLQALHYMSGFDHRPTNLIKSYPSTHPHTQIGLANIAFHPDPEVIYAEIEPTVAVYAVVEVFGLVFNQGVNEMQTLANLSSSRDVLKQVDINQQSFAKLKDFYHQGYKAALGFQLDYYRQDMQEYLVRVNSNYAQQQQQQVVANNAMSPSNNTRASITSPGSGGGNSGSSGSSNRPGMNRRRSMRMSLGTSGNSNSNNTVLTNATTISMMPTPSTITTAVEQLKTKVLQYNDRLLDQLDEAILRSTANPYEKHVEILLKSSMICRQIGGVISILCKSGKDRTSMGVTLENTRSLVEDLGVLNGHEVCQLMRFQGVRRMNVFANTGQSMFAFNQIQRRALPSCYRPPAGCHAGNVTS